jgi:chemotaxis protein MotB
MTSQGTPKAPSPRSGGASSSAPPARRPTPPPPPPLPRPPAGARPGSLPAAPAPGYTHPKPFNQIPNPSTGAAETAPWDEVNLTPSGNQSDPAGPDRYPSAAAEYHAYKETPPPQSGQDLGYGTAPLYAAAASTYGHAPPAYTAAPPASAYADASTVPTAVPQWTPRPPSPDSLLGRTAAKAQKMGNDPYSTNSPPTAVARTSRMGWLVAFLSLSALAAAAWFGLQEQQKLLNIQAKQRDQLSSALAQAQTAATARLEAERSLAAFKEATSAQDVASKEDQKLIGDLKSLLSAKEGEIEAAGKNVSVSLVDDVMFQSGRAELALPGLRVLARVGKLLKDAADRQIVIGGHTDDRPLKKKGGFETNWELSAARAVNVVRYLVEDVGVDPSRISAAAYSQYKPRSKNLAKNRRIEVLLTPALIVK